MNLLLASLPLLLGLLSCSFAQSPVASPPPSPASSSSEETVIKAEPLLAPIGTLPIYSEEATALLSQEVLDELEAAIVDQRKAGHPTYNPELAYLVDPSTQRMHLLSRREARVLLTLPVGTGKAGLGFDSSQTPTGFFTMGGVRIADQASSYIQVGDTKTGVAGIYAEMLYPPSHEEEDLRGRVPNNVIIHGFNPTVSQMLKDRHRKGMIGRVPCTTGCPVLAVGDTAKLAPYLPTSAGVFDAGARPNANLRSLIAKGKVVEYAKEEGLGDAILILDRPFPG
ncbi:MAG: L,D-transpeptidase [Verrucomicrobiota bacterium]